MRGKNVPATGRRLVVIDDYDGGWIDRARAEAPGAIWDVLPLGIDERWYRERHRAALDGLSGFRFLDLANAAEPAHDAVQDFLVPFIADVPRRTRADGRLLVEALASRSGNWWWYLETSEKSPMRSPLVSRLYTLAILRATLDDASYDEVWLAMADGAVGDVLRCHAAALPRLVAARPKARAARRGWLWYWLQALRHVAELVAHRIVARLCGWPAVGVKDGAVLFFSFFPNWWSAPYSARGTDRFFPELPAAHGETPLVRAVWLTEPVTRLWRKRRDIGTALARHNLVIIQRYATLRSAAALLSLRGFLRARRFCRDCERHLAASFAGFDVSPLVLADIRRSFTTGELFRDRLLADALARMSSAARPGALVFRTEGQPCDRALTYGVSGRSLAIGFWHLPIDRHYLPLHYGAGAMARALSPASPADLPVPPRMLVTGTAALETLERQGYPRDRIAICGAVRQPQLARYRSAHPGRAALRVRLGLPGDLPVLFAATSVVRTDSEGLLSALVEALEKTERFRLIVKLHPTLPLEPVFLKWVFDRIGSERATLMPETAFMYDYIAASDAMVVAGSTIAFEAMALDVIPIAFESPAAFSASSLADFADACFVTHTASELRAAIELTVAGAPAARQKQQRAAWAIARAFAFVDRPPLPQLLAALGELGAFGSPVSAAARS